MDNLQFGGRPGGLSQQAAEPVPASSVPASIPDAAKVWLFQSEVAGTLAMWAIRQSPYRCPDNLQIVVEAFSELWPDQIGGMSEWSSQRAIEAELESVSEAIPELLAWNEPKSGHDAPFAFSSRYDSPSPDDDFIDLHALWRNTARSLWADAQAMSAGTVETEGFGAQPASVVGVADAS